MKNQTRQKQKSTKQKQTRKMSPWLWTLLLIPLVIIAFFVLKQQGLILTPSQEETKPTAVLQAEPTAVEKVEALDLENLPNEISVEQAHQLYKDGVFILEVREQDEWDAGHIPGATLIPLGSLAMGSGDVPHLEPVVIVCRSGNRSAQARDVLKSIGFVHVTSMAGGMKEWAAAGYDIEIENKK